MAASFHLPDKTLCTAEYTCRGSRYTHNCIFMFMNIVALPTLRIVHPIPKSSPSSINADPKS